MKKSLLFSLVVLLLVTQSISVENAFGNSPTSTDITLLPIEKPVLVDSARTANFIRSMQNTEINNATNLDQIYYRLMSLKLLDPTLSSLSQSQKDFWISAVLTFQNSNGGFGQWKHDGSNLYSTRKAVEVLESLGSLSSINTTLVGTYLDRLRNILTSGFNSHLSDADSDLYTSALAVETYQMLGLSIVNQTDLLNYFLRGQNNDTAYVPANELGGFGKQTNNKKLIFWTSETTISNLAVKSILSLGGTVTAPDVFNFLDNLQLSTGGFVNDLVLPSDSGSYTSAALETYTLLAGTAPDSALAGSYLSSLETTEGGFKLKPTSADYSLKGTYFAIKGLNFLGLAPSNITRTIELLVNWAPNSGGFGAVPGTSASLRTTFDAVAALTMMDRTPVTVSRILSYVESYRNLDGGFGISGSYTESTLRAVEIYNLLNQPFPDAATTITFLQSLQQADGGFSKGAGLSTSYVISTYRAVRALTLLNAQPTDVVATINYVKSTYVSATGGFGGFYLDTADVSSTYRAVRTLHILGDTSFDYSAVILFLQNSQIADGGFKRSPEDILLPKNISNAIYTYAALRALTILNATPVNITGVYAFITSLRHIDGGYGEHPTFSSDVAYTFTSIWILSNINTFVNFKVTIESDLANIPKSNPIINLTVSGVLLPITYSINVSEFSFAGQLVQQGSLSIGLTNIPVGTYTFDIILTDMSGQKIMASLDVTVVDVSITTSTSSTTTSSTTTSSTTTSTADFSSSTPTTASAGYSLLAILSVGFVSLVIATQLLRKSRLRV